VCDKLGVSSQQSHSGVGFVTAPDSIIVELIAISYPQSFFLLFLLMQLAAWCLICLLCYLCFISLDQVLECVDGFICMFTKPFWVFNKMDATVWLTLRGVFLFL